MYSCPPTFHAIGLPIIPEPSLRCHSSFPLQILAVWRLQGLSTRQALAPPQPRQIKLTEPPLTKQEGFDTARPAEAKAAADPGLKALMEGVELTERSLLNTLEKNGVKKFDPSGEKFDPNFQQAMYEVPDPSVPAGTVMQVVQAGYMIGERVLRPALVAVSKGGAKAPANGNEPNSAA